MNLKLSPKRLFDLLMGLFISLLLTFVFANELHGQKAPGRALSGIQMVPLCDDLGDGNKVSFYRIFVHSSRRNRNGYLTGTFDLNGIEYIPSGSISGDFCTVATAAAQCPADTIINNITNEILILSDSSGMASVETIIELADTSTFSNPIEGSVAVIDNLDDCDGGLIFFDGERWTDPITLIESEDHGRVLYVSTAGAVGRVGDEHCPYPDPQRARDSSISGDLIHLYPGQYVLNSTGSYQDDQLGQAGDTITYFLEASASLVNAGIDMGTGLGRWSDYVTAPSRFDLLGHGSIYAPNPLPGNVSTGIYGNIESHINLERSEGIGNWNFQSGARYSNINVKQATAVGGTIYSSTSSSAQTYPYQHFFSADRLEQGGTSVTLRDQGALDKRGSSNRIEIGTIGITGASANSLIYQRNQGAVGLVSSTRLGNIYNTGLTAGTYAPNQWDSNAARPTEIQILGGNQNTFPNRNVSLFISADNINSTQQLVALQGQIFTDTSNVVIDLPNAFSRYGAGFSLFGGSLKNHSHMLVKGKYVSGSGSAMYLHLNPDNSFRNIDSTSSLVIEGDFRTLESGQPVVRINTPNSFEVPGTQSLYFRDCQLFNDGAAPLFSGTTGQATLLKLDNVSANTTVFTDNQNIEWEGTLTLNDTLIHRRDVRFERKVVDRYGSPGAPGQILVSTGDGVEWRDTTMSTAPPPTQELNFGINAENGTSLVNDSTIQLGNAIGETSAGLLSHREIPTNNFNVGLTGFGNLGIGTATPSEDLEVSSAFPSILLDNTDGSVSAGQVLGQIKFGANDTTPNGAGEFTRIEAVSENTWTQSTTRNGEVNLDVYNTNNQGAPVTSRTARFRYDGGLVLDHYGQGDFSGSVAKLLAVDVTGNVIEADEPDGSETIVQPGNNVTISGTGTGGDPYVINSTATAAIENIYNTSDTLTDDRILTGLGHTLEYNFDNAGTTFNTRWLLNGLEQYVANSSVFTRHRHRANFFEIYTENFPANDFNTIFNGDGYTSMKNANVAEGGISEVAVDSNAIYLVMTGARDLQLNADPGTEGKVIESLGPDKAPQWRDKNEFSNRLEDTQSGVINNYNPPGLDTTHRVVLNLSSASFLTGIEAQSDGTTLHFHVRGASLTLSSNNTGSDPGNRIKTAGDEIIVIRDGGGFAIQHDDVLDYWYLISVNP
ncbi:MAG: hypothetical protein AAFW73_26345 [Bacteroidota bacterium]